MPCRSRTVPSSWWPWPTSSRIASTAAIGYIKRQFGDRVDVPQGPPVRRLRRLPEGDGLPEAGRHRDLRHAAGVPLGAFHLRHPEGAERLHGEAADRGRPDVPQDVRAGRRGDGEEPQGGRGLDVPAQPRAASNWPSASTAAKSATSFSSAATACTAPADRCSRRRSRPASPRWHTRSGASTASSGPAAAASATSTSTSSTIAAG